MKSIAGDLWPIKLGISVQAIQAESGLSLRKTGSLPDLAVTERIDKVIVYHSDGLHMGINDRRTHKTESVMPKVLAECITLGCGRHLQESIALLLWDCRQSTNYLVLRR